jgi:Flp pilus assembly protein TadG
MNDQKQCPRRHAAITVEAAVVLPVMLFLVLLLIVGGMGVFCYQQVACQAREAARWACVRGGDYQKDTNLDSPTQAEIFQNAVLPMVVSMDTSQLSLQVQWIDRGSNTVQPWDGAPKGVKSITPLGEYVTNSVRTTVTYNWVPGLFVGQLTFTSVCELPMAY